MEKRNNPIEITEQSAKKLSVLADRVYETSVDEAAGIAITQRYAAYVLDVDLKRVMLFDLTDDEIDTLHDDDRVDVDRLQEVSIA